MCFIVICTESTVFYIEIPFEIWQANTLAA